MNGSSRYPYGAPIQELCGESVPTCSPQVTIKFATDQIVSAVARDADGVRDVRWSKLGGWDCTCRTTAPTNMDSSTMVATCIHIEAVANVTGRHRSSICSDLAGTVESKAAS